MFNWNRTHFQNFELELSKALDTNLDHFTYSGVVFATEYATTLAESLRKIYNGA